MSPETINPHVAIPASIVLSGLAVWFCWWINRDQPLRWWVFIERQDNPDAAVGPYITKHQAINAMMHDDLVESLCQEDCLDAWVAQVPGKPGPPDLYVVT